MKKVILLLINAILIMSMLSMNVFAKPYNPDRYTSVDEDSALLPETARHSKVSEWAKRRGDFFMGADWAISNEGKGDIGAVGIA